MIALGALTFSQGVATASEPPKAPIPPANIAPNPDMLASGTSSYVNGVLTYENPCFVITNGVGGWPISNNTPACANYSLTAINNAKTQMHESPITLPSNWFALTHQQQEFVLLDMERVSDRYPPYLGLNALLNTTAQRAAAKNAAPSPPKAFASVRFGASWSAGWDALLADYAMMYHDGWGGSRAATSNISCTSATAPGCWSHREELLGSDPGYNVGVGLGCRTCEVGAGWSPVPSRHSSSWALLIEKPTGALPAMTFTWRKELTFFRTTSGSTTTSTSTSLRAPGPVTANPVTLYLSTASVRWASANTTALRRATLYVYRTRNCTGAIHSASTTFVPSSNTNHGVISIALHGLFSPPGPYDARVQVTNAKGTATSRCIALGNS